MAGLQRRVGGLKNEVGMMNPTIKRLIWGVVIFGIATAVGIIFGNWPI